MPLDPGRRLGPYQIVAPLGAGGMGEVYEARDTRLGRTVAIKVLPERLAAHADRRARFEREARAISQLSHPHVCTLHDVGEEEGVHFLVLEHCEGETLAARLERGSLPLREVLRFGAEIGEALDAAHRRGVIHRDLKPSNVILTAGGVKLLDFGLARLAAGEGEVRGDLPTMTYEQSQPLTDEGTVLGTYPYMAPEQVEGREADARSDVFALGAVLHEMTTGRRAFDGESAASIMAAVLREEPVPLSQLEPVSPPALDHVVSRCLAKDPDERWQSAKDVALEMHWIGSGESAPAPHPKSDHRWRSWLGWGVAAVLAISLAVFASSRSPSETAVSPVIRAQIAAPEGTSFHLETMNPAPVAVAPDGTRVVFGARDASGLARLWLRRLDSETARELPGTRGAGYPFWSPDGRRVGFFAEGDLRTIDLATGEVQTLCPALRGKGGTWSRQGVIVFAPSWDGPLFKVSANGGKPEQVTGLHGSTSGSHRFPIFLPDGRRFLYLAVATFTRSRGRIEVGALDGREPEVLLPESDFNVAYVSDRLIYVRDGRLLAQALDPETLTVSGEPIRLASDVHSIPDAFNAVFSLSPNGVLAYHRATSKPETRLVWLDRTGVELGTIAEPSDLMAPSISPDESRIAVDVLDTNGRGDIHLYDVATGVATRLTSGDDHEYFPIWTPDGESVVYAVRGASGTSLQEASTRGGADATRLLEGSSTLVPWDVSPDGRHLLFGVAPEGSSEIALRSVAIGSSAGSGSPPGSAIPAVSGFPQVTRAQFSPDGQWIAVTAVEAAAPYVYLVPFGRAGRAWKMWKEPAQGPRWSGDGREVYMLSASGELVAMEVQLEEETFQAGPVETLFAVPAGPGVSLFELVFDAAADGNRFLFTLPAGERVEPMLTIVSDWMAIGKDG